MNVHRTKAEWNWQSECVAWRSVCVCVCAQRTVSVWDKAAYYFGFSGLI